MTFFDVFPTPCQFWPGADRCDHEIFGVIYTYWNLGILRHFWSKKGVILAKMAKTPFLKGVILQRLFLFHGSWSFLKLASRNHQNDPFGPFWHFWPFLAILSICPGLSSSLNDPFSGSCNPEKAWKKGFSGGSKMTHLSCSWAVMWQYGYGHMRSPQISFWEVDILAPDPEIWGCAYTTYAAMRAIVPYRGLCGLQCPG